MNVIVIKSHELFCCSPSGVCRTVEHSNGDDVLSAVESLSPSALLFLETERPDPIEYICRLRRRNTVGALPVAIVRFENELPCPLQERDQGCKKMLSVLRNPFPPDTTPNDKRPYTLFIDIRARELSLAGKRITCSPAEFRLFMFLLRYPGVIYSRQELLRRIRDNGACTDSRLVDVLVRRIRSKIENELSASSYVRTVRGFGYGFNAQTDIFLDKLTGRPFVSWPCPADGPVRDFS